MAYGYRAYFTYICDDAFKMLFCDWIINIGLKSMIIWLVK